MRLRRVICLPGFQPTVFPQILGSFARVFDLGIGEMLKRFRAQGSQGLGIALSEAVAALDRLGHYCFTGTPIALMSSVLGPLKTMESLEKGGWPYLDPQLLDLRIGEGSLDVIRWPRAQDGRAISTIALKTAFLSPCTRLRTGFTLFPNRFPPQPRPG